MSEYLSKVLEFIKARKAKFAGSYKDIEYGAYMELETIEAYIESGAFDADEEESEGTWKAIAEVLGRENAQMNSEVQRLRAVLERIRKIAKESREAKYYVDNHLLIETIVEQALSTTTEPTGPSISKTQIENIKKMFNDPAYNGIYRSGIFNVLEELGITIPGINAPEGDGNDV